MIIHVLKIEYKLNQNLNESIYCYEMNISPKTIKGKYDDWWNNNRIYGKGVFTWIDDRRYEGDYWGDKKEGEIEWSRNKNPIYNYY